jgi:hypothetical protein
MTRDSELRELLNAFGETGADKGIFTNRDIAHLAASGHKILSMRNVEGLEVDAKESLTGISAKVIVKEGLKIKNPVHLCFGVLQAIKNNV